jgi:hypothetical protein
LLDDKLQRPSGVVESENLRFDICGKHADNSQAPDVTRMARFFE